MSVSMDLQANGWRDTGGAEGAVATVRADADLAMVPLRNTNHYVEAFGSGAATATAALFTSNPDGSGQGFNVTTGAIGTGNAVRIWVPFNGRCFGVRWNAINTTPDFTVVVDGESVAVEGWPAWLTREGVTTQLVHARAMALTHDHLDPALPHVAQINFVGDAAAIKTWVFFGLLLDRRFAFERPQPYVFATTPTEVVTTLTASQAKIPVTNSAGERALSAIRKVFYANTDSVARVVTIKYGSVIVEKLYLAAAGTAGDCGEFDPGGVLASAAALTHAADAALVVSFQVIGAY